MWDLAVREEDYDAVDAMLSRYARAPLSMRLLPVFARADSAARARFITEATNSDSRQSQISARYVATFLEDFAAAESLARLDLAARRRPPIRLGAQLFLAWLELARGRWSAGNAAFENAKRMEGATGVELERAIAATMPFLEVPKGDLGNIRVEVERADPNPGGGGGTGGLASSLRSHLRLYLLSVLSSRLGDDQAAARYAAELEALPAVPDAGTVGRDLARTARADLALRNGRPAEALALLEPVQGEVPLELVYYKVFATVREFGQEHARYLRAEALMALRRYDEARRWYRTAFQGSPAEMVYLAPGHLRQAQIYEARGERDQAAAHYQRFVKLWADSDPALRSRVSEAHGKLSTGSGARR
jgi:tetratricopeptide (TPR) repeat protein